MVDALFPYQHEGVAFLDAETATNFIQAVTEIVR